MKDGKYVKRIVSKQYDNSSCIKELIKKKHFCVAGTEPVCKCLIPEICLDCESSLTTISVTTPTTYLHIPHPFVSPSLFVSACVLMSLFSPWSKGRWILGRAEVTASKTTAAPVLPSQAHTRWCLQASTRSPYPLVISWKSSVVCWLICGWTTGTQIIPSCSFCLLCFTSHHVAVGMQLEL